MSASDSVTPGLYADALAASYRRLHPAHKYAFRTFLIAFEMIADFLTCAAGIASVFALDAFLHGNALIHSPLRQLATLCIMGGSFAVLGMQRDGAYAGGGSLLQISETARALRISLQSVFLLLPFCVLLSIPAVSIREILFAPIAVAILLMLQKQAFLFLICLLHRREYGVKRVVLYGAGTSDRRIISAFLHSLRLGFVPVAVIDDKAETAVDRMLEMGYRGRRSIPVYRASITTAQLNAWRCSTLVIVTSALSVEEIATAANAAKLAGTEVAYVCAPHLYEAPWTELINLDGVAMTAIIEPSAASLYATGKRVIDFVLSSLLLVILSPFLLIIAALVRLDSPGPVLFIQKRVGQNGELFKMYKFRSMYANSPQYEASPTSSSDPRITRAGRLLRRLSLDELPQLINVILGDMSLVGPRPEMPFIVQSYSSEQRRRLEAIPGITGLWQLSADRAFPIHENIQYDLYYIRNRGFFMDIAILIHTMFFAMRSGI